MGDAAVSGDGKPRMRRAGLAKLRRRAGLGPGLDAPLSDQREAFAQLLELTTIGMPAHGCESITLAGHGCSRLTPETVTSPRTVVYIHGGGYVLGSPESHRPLATRVAHAAQAATIMLRYRLAPEHPCPAGLDDLDAQWQALPEGLRREAILAGDSAGGGLALALAMRIRDREQALPAGLALLSPWIDLTLTAASIDANAEHEVLFTRAGLELMARRYAGSLARDDRRVSPLFAGFEGLPPMLLQAGAQEMLLDDAHAAARAARAAGVEVELQIYADQAHVFQATPMLEAAGEALAALAAWIGDR